MIAGFLMAQAPPAEAAPVDYWAGWA